MCFALNNKTATFKNSVNFKEANISPSGRWFLYQKKDPVTESIEVVLFDLDTSEERVFLSEPFPDYLKYRYGFAKDSSFLYGMTDGGRFVKVLTLPDMKESLIPVTEGRAVYILDSTTEGKLIIIEMQKDHLLLAHVVADELSHAINGTEMEWEVSALARDYHRKKPPVDLFLRVVNAVTLDQSETVVPSAFKKQCTLVDFSSRRVFRVHKDGRLTATQLTGLKETIQIFDAVEGFELSENPVESEKQCDFLADEEDTNVLRDPKGKGYIVRSIKTGEESFLPADFFVVPMEINNKVVLQSTTFRFISQMKSLIQYPFVSGPLKRRIRHIPTGQDILLDDLGSFHLGARGQSSIEGREVGGKKLLQFVSHPLNLYQRKVIFEIPRDDACVISLLPNSSLTYVVDLLGTLFIVDMESGAVRRFFGFEEQCSVENGFMAAEGGALLGINRQGKHTAYKWDERCVVPASSFLPDRETVLRELSGADDITETSRLSQLTALLGAEVTDQKYPALLRDVMWNVLSRSSNLYLALHRHYPHLTLLPVEDLPLALRGDDGDFQERLRSGVESLLDVTTSTIRYTRLSDWDFLRMLKPLLRRLPEEKKDHYMERITVSVSNGAAKEIPLLQDVFQSKIYYAAYGHVKEIFGLQRRPVSDVTVIRKLKSFSTIILASDSITGEAASVATEFGLHYAVPEEAGRQDLDKALEKTPVVFDDFVEWRLPGENRYRARIRVSAGNQINTFVSPTTPHYDSIWRDHSMTGVIIVGSSLRGFSSILVEEYLSYFEGEGFQFSGAEKDEDLKTFLLTKMKNCEADYFLKESHSDGDERNVFRFDRLNYIVRGVRYGDEGRIETVYLVFPRHLGAKEENTDVFSIAELKEAVAVRELKGCGQLTYFNTSCWSHVKARSEIEAVNSPLFLNIPAINLSDTFLNSETSAIRILLDSYRRGRDFKGFRSALQANKGFQSGNRDRYIFPDEAVYRDKIMMHILTPLEIHVQLEKQEGGKWQKKEPDEAL